MTNVAVIGMGNMGINHARVYSELDRANLVAVSDVGKSGREIARKFKCKFYKNYEKMLDEEIDAISIAVPTKLHKKVALECINANKHVLIEKPIADTIENGEKIISAAKSKGVLVMVGHIERFNPAVQKLREIIKQGKLGDINSIIARRVGVFPPQIKDANVILDLAVHDIDVFNYLLEKKPDEIYAKADRILNDNREDHAMILLNYAETKCFIQVNWTTPVKIRNLAVTGVKGYGELNYITQDLKIYESVYEKTYDSFGDFMVKFGTPKHMKIEVEKEEPLKVELKHFIGCVERKEKPLVSGEDGLLALKLSLDAVNSYKNENIIKV